MTRFYRCGNRVDLSWQDGSIFARLNDGPWRPCRDLGTRDVLIIFAASATAVEAITAILDGPA